MESGKRHKIDELVTKYKHHPEIKDVFTEGAEDVAIFDWFFSRAELSDVNVYQISSIEIPTDLLFQYGFPDGNRSRVMVLAFELKSEYGISTNQVTCIADKDFDFLLSFEYECPLLFFSDYTCLEMYFYDTKCIEKLFTIALYGFNKNPKEFLDLITVPLQEIFLYRFTNEILGWGLSDCSLSKSCSLNETSIILDSSHFIDRYLHTKNLRCRKDSFIRYSQLLKSSLTDNQRLQINGHDYIDILSWYLKQKRVPHTLCRDTYLHSNLFMSIEYEQIKTEPLFANLLLRLRS